MSSEGGNETREGLCNKFLPCLIEWSLSAHKKVWSQRERKNLPVSVWGTGYSSLSLAGGGSPLDKQLSATCTTTFSIAWKVSQILSISRLIVFSLLVNLDINLCKMFMSISNWGRRGGRANPVTTTRVSNGMAGGADLIFPRRYLPRPGSRPQSAASGLFIALVIQIPAVSVLGRAGHWPCRPPPKMF